MNVVVGFVICGKYVVMNLLGIKNRELGVDVQGKIIE